MTQPEDAITVYADYVCPFCYLGRRSLEAYQETRERALDVQWRPFDLRSGKRGPDGAIDHSVDDGKDEAYFDEVRRNVDRLTERYDAEEMLGLDDVPDPVDSFDAQLVSSHVQAEHPQRWLAFDEAVYEALWVEGRDVSDVAVLTDVAEAVGLDGDEVRRVVADDGRRDRLREQFAAAQAAGVTGVPTFVYDGYRARGAMPPEQLARLVEGA